MRIIYDSAGRVKYRVEETGSGAEIYDSTGALRYRYIKASDQTFDANGALITKGNILLDI